MKKTIRLAAMAIMAAAALTTVQAQDAAKKDDAKAKSRFEQMDTNQDGFVSFEEYAIYWTNIAKSEDTNKDGKIDAADLKARAKQHIATLDANKDEILTQEELLGAKSEIKGDAKLGPKFADVDTNKDGKLSRDEVNAGAAAWYARMDKNNDSKVDAAEAETAMAASFVIMDVNKDGVVTIEEYVLFFAPKADAKKDDVKKEEPKKDAAK